MLELIDGVLTSVPSDNEHLSEIELDVAPESTVASTSLPADSTAPSQCLKSLEFHLVGEVFGCSNCGLPSEIANEGRARGGSILTFPSSLQM